MDINEKLRSLTPEQANKLAGHLNSCYPDRRSLPPRRRNPRRRAARRRSNQNRIRRAAEGAMPPAAFSVPSRREVTRFGKGRK